MSALAWYDFVQLERTTVEPYFYGSAVIGRKWTFVAHLPIDRSVGGSPSPLALPPAEKTNLAAADYGGRARLGLDGGNISSLGVWVKGKPVLVQEQGYIRAAITAVEPIART